MIINDKRDTPVNDILFLLVSSIGKSALRFMPMMRFSHIICTNGYKKRDKLHTGSYPFSSQYFPINQDSIFISPVIEILQFIIILKTGSFCTATKQKRFKKYNFKQT